MDVVFEGEVARSAETGASIARGLLIGLVGVCLSLSFQFRSYVEPLIVMLAIPLTFIGAIWGHVLMGYYLSMPSLIGAAGHASRDRFCAILITSSTTIAGLLPLLLEPSTQADAIKPLVVSVVFGLLTITVLVIPALYVLFDVWGWTRRTGEAESG